MAYLVFWLAVLSLAYVYIGFPLLLIVVGRLRRREVRKAPITPRLSLIIPAYNEAEVIAQRLRNDLLADYPRDALEMIVVSDGSTDETDRIVEGFSDDGVILLRVPRLGKNSALEAAVARSTGDILVFSDANIFCDHQAYRMLAANFADDSVGGVAGNVSYRIRPGSESSSQGESLYWRYDTWLKELESATGSIVSAHGALHAIRRELYRPIEVPSAVDDFAISTAVVEQGHRLVFEPAARGYEFTIPRAGSEFRRRVRFMTMGMTALALRRRLLNPFRFGFYSVILVTHKVLRRLLPFSILALFGSSLALSGSGWFYSAAAQAQLLFYALAVAGLVSRSTGIGRRRLLYVPFYFCMANTAALVALVHFIRGQRLTLWQPQRHDVWVRS